MSAFSAWYQEKIINFVRGTAITPAPTSLEIRLHTANPLDDYSGATEVGAGVGYTKQAIVLSVPTTVNGVGSTTINVGNVIFGPCSTTPWGSITHWSIHGVGADTNFYFYGSFLAAKAIGIGDSYTIPNATLQILVR